MVTFSQRLEELRTRKGLSRPALAAELNLPKMSIEKYESGRITPTQELTKRLADYFGVSEAYLRCETDELTQMDDWLDTVLSDEEPAPVTKAAARPTVLTQSDHAPKDGAMFSALLKSPAFKELLRQTVREELSSPEGRKLLASLLHK